MDDPFLTIFFLGLTSFFPVQKQRNSRKFVPLGFQMKDNMARIHIDLRSLQLSALMTRRGVCVCSPTKNKIK